MGWDSRKKKRERDRDLKKKNSVSPRKKLEKNRKDWKKKWYAGWGCCKKKKKVRERLKKTRDSNARDTETTGETGKKETR